MTKKINCRYWVGDNQGRWWTSIRKRINRWINRYWRPAKEPYDIPLWFFYWQKTGGVWKQCQKDLLCLHTLVTAKICKTVKILNSIRWQKQFLSSFAKILNSLRQLLLSAIRYLLIAGRERKMECHIKSS